MEDTVEGLGASKVALLDCERCSRDRRGKGSRETVRVAPCGQAERPAFQDGAHLAESANGVCVRVHDEGAALRADDYEALARQAGEGFPDRGSADPECHGEGAVGQACTEGKLALDDATPDLGDGLLAKHIGGVRHPYWNTS